MWLYVNYFYVLIIVYERTVQCCRAGWCWWLPVDVVLSPFCGLDDEIRTESLQRSTDKEPPLHQRRITAETDLTQSPVRKKTYTYCHLLVTLQKHTTAQIISFNIYIHNQSHDSNQINMELNNWAQNKAKLPTYKESSVLNH